MIEHMPNPEGLTVEDRRSQYDGWLSQLNAGKNDRRKQEALQSVKKKDHQWLPEKIQMDGSYS